MPCSGSNVRFDVASQTSAPLEIQYGRYLLRRCSNTVGVGIPGTRLYSLDAIANNTFNADRTKACALVFALCLHSAGRLM
jgi:hypothetical protein